MQGKPQITEESNEESKSFLQNLSKKWNLSKNRFNFTRRVSVKAIFAELFSLNSRKRISGRPLAA